MPNEYGIKVAKRNYTVNSLDQKQIVTSEYPLLKSFEVNTGTLSKVINDSSKTVTINHNLGYVPQVYVFGEYLDENDYPTATVINRYKLFSWSDTPGLELWDFYRYYADEDNLYIIYTTTAYITSLVQLNYIYYIFYDPES